MLKCAPSINLGCYKDEVDNKMKKCETLDKWLICFVKVSTHQITTLSSLKKKEVENYYKYVDVY